MRLSELTLDFKTRVESMGS